MKRSLPSFHSLRYKSRRGSQEKFLVPNHIPRRVPSLFESNDYAYASSIARALITSSIRRSKRGKDGDSKSSTRRASRKPSHTSEVTSGYTNPLNHSEHGSRCISRMSKNNSRADNTRNNSIYRKNIEKTINSTNNNNNHDYSAFANDMLLSGLDTHTNSNNVNSEKTSIEKQNPGAQILSQQNFLKRHNTLRVSPQTFRKSLSRCRP